MLGDPRPGRRTQPASAETGWVLAAGVLTAVLGGALLWTVGARLDPATRTHTAGGPVELLLGRATGNVPVGGVQLAVFGLGPVVLLVVAAAFVVVVRRTQKTRTRIDHLAPKMAKAREFDALTEPHAARDAERLRALAAGPGVPLAKLVNNGKRLYASREWVQIWLMGPRAGKTTSVCVPRVPETKGPVVATSEQARPRGPDPRAPVPDRGGVGPRRAGHHRGRTPPVVEPAVLHHGDGAGRGPGGHLRVLGHQCRGHPGRLLRVRRPPAAGHALLRGIGGGQAHHRRVRLGPGPRRQDPAGPVA
uniref:Uncharacterized protein n=1 Tax=Janibacter limosus TaxID=53458 RepID=A0AC61U2P6_9MICO|nr:hypothetical protein [Janibacter limosus]